jgi:hypothetical protein
MNLDEGELKRAQKYARKKFNELREEGGKWAGHASHAAAEALRRAEEHVGLGTFGVEGFCDSAGSQGFSYLNTGETYDLTLGVYTTYATARFVLTSWGDVAELHPDWG